MFTISKLFVTYASYLFVTKPMSFNVVTNNSYYNSADITHLYSAFFNRTYMTCFPFYLGTNVLHFLSLPINSQLNFSAVTYFIIAWKYALGTPPIVTMSFPIASISWPIINESLRHVKDVVSTL